MLCAHISSRFSAPLSCSSFLLFLDLAAPSFTVSWPLNALPVLLPFLRILLGQRLVYTAFPSLQHPTHLCACWLSAVKSKCCWGQAWHFSSLSPLSESCRVLWIEQPIIKCLNPICWGIRLNSIHCFWGGIILPTLNPLLIPGLPLIGPFSWGLSLRSQFVLSCFPPAP